MNIAKMFKCKNCEFEYTFVFNVKSYTSKAKYDDNDDDF